MQNKLCFHLHELWGSTQLRASHNRVEDESECRAEDGLIAPIGTGTTEGARGHANGPNHEQHKARHDEEADILELVANYGGNGTADHIAHQAYRES